MDISLGTFPQLGTVKYGNSEYRMYKVELDREYKRCDPWLQLVRCALLQLLGRISERRETEGMDGGRISNSEPSPDYGLGKGRMQV